jgi:hypothetical protein
MKNCAFDILGEAKVRLNKKKSYFLEDLEVSIRGWGRDDMSQV